MSLSQHPNKTYLRNSNPFVKNTLPSNLIPIIHPLPTPNHQTNILARFFTKKNDFYKFYLNLWQQNVPHGRRRFNRIL